MFSILDTAMQQRFRSWRVAAAAALICVAMAGGGCARTPLKPLPPQPYSNTPLMIDEAMQQRDWSPSVAEYADGQVVAFPTRFVFETSHNQPEWVHYLADPPVFLTDMILLPFTLIKTPPFTLRAYGSANTDPTYNAMPQLPPEPQSSGTDFMPPVPSGDSDSSEEGSSSARPPDALGAGPATRPGVSNDSEGSDTQ